MTNPSQIEALFPEDSRPEPRLGQPTGFVRSGLTPLAISGLLRTLVGHWLADAATVTDPGMRRTVTLQDTWRETLTDNRQDHQDDRAGFGYYVELSARWRRDLAGARPSILIHGQDWTWQRVALDNRQSVDSATGDARYEGQWIGAHTLFAVSPDEAEAMRLGYEVGTFLQMIAPEVARQLNLSRLEVSRIGQISRFEDYTDLFAVPVDLPYIVSFSWQIQPEAPRFQRLRYLLTGDA